MPLRSKSFNPLAFKPAVFSEGSVAAALAPLPQGAAHVHWRMLQAAFAAKLLPVPPMLLAICGGAAAFILSGRLAFVIWALITLAAMVACRRLAVTMAQSTRSHPASFWAGRYVMYAWAEAAIAGAGGALAALDGSPSVCAVMLGPLGFVASRAGYGIGFTRAAQGQALLLLLPGAIACLTAGSHGIAALGFLALLQASWAVSMAGEDALARESHGAAAPIQHEATNEAQKSVMGSVLARDVGFQEAFGRDAGTGLPNRPRFLHMVALESLRAVLSNAPLSVILVQCNEDRGDYGGRPLETVPEMLARKVPWLQAVLWRPGDALANFGDGRLAVLLPFTDAMGCATVARKLRASWLEPATDAHAETASLMPSVTLSMGTATYIGYGPLPPTQLMEFAEQALIDARRLGGDQTCRHDTLIETLRPAAYKPAAPATATAPTEPLPHPETIS